MLHNHISVYRYLPATYIIIAFHVSVLICAFTSALASSILHCLRGTNAPVNVVQTPASTVTFLSSHVCEQKGYAIYLHWEE